MAARFVVLVALFALCNSNPVLENGDEIRDGRALKYGSAWSRGDNGGTNVASAEFNGQNAKAFGSNVGSAAPGQANAVVYESDAKQEALNIPRVQPFGYYPAVPAPARVIYQQNIPSAGYAKSDAETTPLGSRAQSIAVNNQPAAIIAQPAKAVYTPVAIPQRKSIRWHFGTAYGTPQYVVKTPEYVVPAYKPIAYEAAPVAGAPIVANANTQGEGEADSKASQNSLGSEATAHSQSQNSGVAASGASVGANGPAYYRNAGSWNSGRLNANTASSGNGKSDAKALNNFNGQIVNSIASSGINGAARSGAQSY